MDDLLSLRSLFDQRPQRFCFDVAAALGTFATGGGGGGGGDSVRLVLKVGGKG